MALQNETVKTKPDENGKEKLPKKGVGTTEQSAVVRMASIGKKIS